MIRKMTMWAITALLVVAFSAPMAFAISPQDAEELGCFKVKGTVTCPTTDLPGNSDENTKGNPPEATIIDETQGNLSNKSPEESQDLATDECILGSPGLCKQAESGKF